MADKTSDTFYKIELTVDAFTSMIVEHDFIKNIEYCRLIQIYSSGMKKNMNVYDLRYKIDKELKPFIFFSPTGVMEFHDGKPSNLDEYGYVMTYKGKGDINDFDSYDQIALCDMRMSEL